MEKKIAGSLWLMPADSMLIRMDMPEEWRSGAKLFYRLRSAKVTPKGRKHADKLMLQIIGFRCQEGEPLNPET